MTDILTETFDRCFRLGIESLSPREQDLYRIQDFILEFEMNGLSGYFYNRILNIASIEKTIQAMLNSGMVDVANLLINALTLLKPYEGHDEQKTWSEVLATLDPTNQLSVLESNINKIPDYGFKQNCYA